MLYEFVTTHRNAIIERSRQKLTARPWLPAAQQELENGVPMFLAQLSDVIRSTSANAGDASEAIGSAGARYGRDLTALGFTVSQVVHAYGDICQALTEIAIEQQVAITTEEFRTLSGCLDAATAEAVTEHARLTAEARSAAETERLGDLAHEIRDLLNTAIIAYEALKRGTVAINGTTGAVLGRSLMGLRDLVDNTQSVIRLDANQQRREHVFLTPFLENIAGAARLQAESRGLQFTTHFCDPASAVMADPQLLASAVTNLLNNAFKYTRPGGRVVLRAQIEGEARLLIAVEDECGGITIGEGDLFQSFGKRRGRDQSGLGLGLSIARRAVRAHGGDISIVNVPGRGCVFTIDVPRIAAEGSGTPADGPEGSHWSAIEE